MAEETALSISNLTHPQSLFMLPNPKLANEMGQWYKNIIAVLESRNEEEVSRLNVTLVEAGQREGDTEISEALRTWVNYLTRIGDKDEALEVQVLASKKTPGLGSRIDIVLAIDRRNRLIVHTAVHLISIRQFKPAADLFLDALSTFTATELINFNNDLRHGTLTLSRPDLKKPVISAPKVNQVVPELPVLAELYKNLYESHYDKFFKDLATLEHTILILSRILNPHAHHYLREMRILAYTQLLESYRSLTLASLSAAFGVGEGFVDNELSRFIASGRIHARIDKVNGVVETRRPSKKSAQYEVVVRRGDLLLNEVQRLSKVLH
ncbi:PCI-domain-containing protein [Coprinopsis marcescibilis]|uniref:PCI-domain-containing protein n=1 Tax=Coprinopsis marcescibilis TaxID=230819 RepID=A0A5C3KEJ6_COPMA|nr:PCI-domain-containing protein [Coprinopsis marcescibilis]